MQLVTIGPKYQVVIPKEIRKKFKDIQPGSKVAVKADKNIIAVKPVAKNWSDKHYGAFKKYWKGINMIEEVEKMRDEWEERLKELEKLYK